MHCRYRAPQAYPRLLSTVAVLLVAGCRPTTEHAAEKQIDRTYQIDPSASLSVRNASGSIIIRGSDAAELRVRATMRAENAQRLSEIAVNVSAESDVVSIATTFPPEKKRFAGGTGTVDYVLTVPRTVKIARLDMGDGKVVLDGMRGSELRATVVDGELALRNCFGNARVDVANGSIEVSYDRWDSNRFILDARITNGDAHISIPRSASFRLLAETLKGKVVNHWAEAVELNGRAPTKAELVIGTEAQPDLKIRATTGDIRISQTAAIARD
jgi:hypothetical protein